MVKNLPVKAGDVRDTSSLPESGRYSGGRNGQPTPVFVPTKFHRQRSLAGYSLGGRKESEATEQTRDGGVREKNHGTQLGPEILMSQENNEENNFSV